MLKAGITGGIGSGKSVVCQVFRTLGIPVFDADSAARQLMEQDPALMGSIRQLLGDDVYPLGRLDRAKVASIIYSQPAKLQQLNALVHPATIAFGRKWIALQTSPYVIKESAIFFESNSDKEMDLMIGVFAPVEVRIQRAMARGNLSKERVLAIMDEQMDDDEKMRRCAWVITNDGKTAVLPQILELHAKLLAQSAGLSHSF